MSEVTKIFGETVSKGLKEFKKASGKHMKQAMTKSRKTKHKNNRRGN